MEMSQQEFVPCTQDSDIQVLEFSQNSTHLIPSTCPPAFSIPTKKRVVATRSPINYVFPSQMIPPFINPVPNNPAPHFIHPASNTIVPPSPFPVVQTTQPASTQINANQKKRGRPKGDKECSKIKKQADPTIDSDEDAAPRTWPEHHVVALLHARGDMIAEFSAPPKQGVDLWKKVCTRVVAACPDFKKDSKACRKKFQYVFKQYQKDISWNACSGHDRRQTCPHYNLLDSYFGERANVNKHVHAGAIEVEDKCDDEEEEPIKKEIKKEVPELGTAKKKAKATALSLMEKVLATGEELSKSLQRHEENEGRKLHIMEEMQRNFAAFIEKMK